MKVRLTGLENGCTGQGMNYAVCTSCVNVHKVSDRIQVPVDGGYETACPRCQHLWHRKYCSERVVRVVHRDDGTRLDCVALPAVRKVSEAAHG